MFASWNRKKLVHATYNRDTDTCDGIRYVKTAHLRAAAKGNDLANADFKNPRTT